MTEETKEGVGYVPDDIERETNEAKSKDKNSENAENTKKKHNIKKTHFKHQELTEMLQKVQEERDELKDKYLRGLAEIDNFRKRIKKEKEEYQKYVMNEFLLDLLQIFDNLERALKAKNSDNEKSITAGVEIIRKQLLDLLKKYNVLEIDALGKHFDPVFHEALSKEERPDITAPVVVEIYQKGFTYNNKLLRPVLTKVATPSENKDNHEADKKS